MKELKKEKLEKVILILFLIFGLVYAYITVLFLPEWTVIQSSTSQLNAQENHYQELLSYQNNQSGLQEEIKTLEAKVLQLNAQLPNRIDNPQLMVGLYTLAKQHSVIPQTLAFEQAQTKGAYQEMGMSFSCLGKTTDILTMVHDLQFGGGQRLEIKSISLTGTQQNMRADLKLTAYASLGSSGDSTQGPAFMNSSFGVDTPEKLFQP
ncbi:type 4a pilus biogenesis protein PilO [Desulfosporosinus shakirovi]|uniref:type 4a pilus biogenesis protein PilO n=1 Tax=Desulfosporosinus shakirovi TaxID=2885154 RepID=UPI001E506C86|nr:type 4a pilus biogenesis protein PilO [Desulfosporosinus sp. SRJS8]MCB8817976.1 type 4a pilus biogenesis protein PilO [Desulfosporosinus sp. SRJS8]